jgi:hypothetical protein
VYKLKGIEYLPEGFLELEPLLYKDEFFFRNPYLERLFEDEQKKLKVLRRKQYMQKDQQKKRDVTIFIIDEYRNKMAEFLESWYTKNKRNMSEEEVAQVAQVLQIDPGTVKELEGLFLERKKLQNVSLLKKYLLAEGNLQNQSFRNLPKSI